MTYRDDHDAALARSDALAAEVERLEKERDQAVAERDRLAAERDQAVAERDRAAARPAGGSAGRRKRTRKEARAARRAAAATAATDATERGGRAAAASARTRILFGVLGGVFLLGVFALPIAADCSGARAHDRWRAQVEARQRHKDRWQALIAVEPCTRWVAFDTVMVLHLTPERFDPRRDRVHYAMRDLTGNCTGGARWLVADPATAPAVRDGLERWLAVEAALKEPSAALTAYYANRDWLEDDLRGARRLWDTALALLAERRRVFADLRASVLPVLRDEIRALQRAHEAAHGRDELWWRIELGLALWAINDRSYEVSGILAGRDPDTAAAALALREPVAALLAAARDAPLEIRRQLRKLDWLTTPLAQGLTPGGEEPLWHLAHPEADLLQRGSHDTPPAMPPDPGPEPDHGD